MSCTPPNARRFTVAANARENLKSLAVLFEPNQNAKLKSIEKTTKTAL
jgi:hypothetical protein